MIPERRFERVESSPVQGHDRTLSLDPPGVDYDLIIPAAWSQFRLRDRLGLCVHDFDPTTADYTIEIGWMGTNPDENPSFETHPSCIWWSQVVWTQ